jgi:hypothetical protein
VAILPIMSSTSADVGRASAGRPSGAETLVEGATAGAGCPASDVRVTDPDVVDAPSPSWDAMIWVK